MGRRPGRCRIRSLFQFDRRRGWVFGSILAFVYVLGFFGVWAGIFLPFLGAVPFIAALMVWYVPGVLLSWTGFFRFHEFGAEPTGWEGHLLMLVFYGIVALLLSWPFGRKSSTSSRTAKCS